MAHPDSVTDPEPITVLFTTGVERHYARVEPWPQGLLRAYGADGGVQYLERSKVRMIYDEKNNLTQQILDRGKSAGERPSVRKPGKPSFFRGRPLPIKKAFPLIQAGLLGRIYEHDEDAAEAVAFDLGVMENKSPRHSLGISLGLVSDTDYTRIALKPRYRRWLGNTFSLDIAPGVFLPLGDEDDSRGSIGFLGELSLSAGDWVSLTALVEVVETEEYFLPRYSDVTSKRSSTDVSSYLGLKAGGEAGIVTTVLMAAAIAASSSR